MVLNILGPPGCGGSFIDWSMYFLQGISDRLLIGREGFRVWREPVYASPIKDSQNAHAHKKNHPTVVSFPKHAEIMDQYPGEFISTYCIDDMTLSESKSNFNQLVTSYTNYKFIRLQFTPRDLHQLFVMQFEKIPEHVNYIKKSLKEDAIWIKRKDWAIDYYDSVYPMAIAEPIINANNQISLPFKSVLNGTLLSEIKNIFTDFGLQIDEGQVPQWESVYQDWMQLNSTKFYTDLYTIVDAIRLNEPLSLIPYNMSVGKEIVLEGILRSKYHLNLHADGMEHLPDNTQDWYNLLR